VSGNSASRNVAMKAPARRPAPIGFEPAGWPSSAANASRRPSSNSSWRAVALPDRLGELLPRIVIVELVFADQVERQAGTRAHRQGAEIIEALGDQLPIAHDESGIALAQGQQCGVVLAATAHQSGACCRIMERVFDRLVQATGTPPSCSTARRLISSSTPTGLERSA
jgi:hypothetical protein